MRVLVVDDSASEVSRIKQIVERAGHHVLVARDGLEAVELATLHLPDMIFMDIVMPKMDGFRATRHIATDPATAHIPIVLVSTKSQSVDVAWAKKQGAATLIAKPYTPAAVLEQLSVFNRG